MVGPLALRDQGISISVSIFICALNWLSYSQQRSLEEALLQGARYSAGEPLPNTGHTWGNDIEQVKACDCTVPTEPADFNPGFVEESEEPESFNSGFEASFH